MHDAKIDNLHLKQRRAGQLLKEEGTWNLGRPNNIGDLTKWFEIYNDDFFTGLVTRMCKLNIVNLKEKINETNVTMGGYCSTTYPGFEDDPQYRLERLATSIALAFQHGDPCKFTD